MNNLNSLLHTTCFGGLNPNLKSAKCFSSTDSTVCLDTFEFDNEGLKDIVSETKTFSTNNAFKEFYNVMRNLSLNYCDHKYVSSITELHSMLARIEGVCEDFSVNRFLGNL